MEISKMTKLVILATYRSTGLTKWPGIQQKAQKEIDAIIGED